MFRRCFKRGNRFYRKRFTDDLYIAREMCLLALKNKYPNDLRASMFTYFFFH